MKTRIINQLKSRAIKTKASYEFPTYKTTGAKDFIFCEIFGVRGAGKSTAVLTMLENDKDILMTGDNIVYFVSPTFDDKCELIRSQNPDNFIHIEELSISNLHKTLDAIKARVEKWEEDRYLIMILKKYLEGEKLDEIDLALLEDYSYLEDMNIEEFNTDHPPISTLVIDDSLGSPLISSANSKQGKEFLKWAIRHRHRPSYCNLFILSQHIKSISKPLRVNANLIILFPLRDREVLKNIFHEYASLFKNKYSNIEELMNEVEKRPHAFIYMYYDSKREVRINWSEAVDFD